MGIRKADLWLRIDRLGELTLELPRDRVAWERAEGPLLYLERRAYLAAIRTAIRGVEDARVILAKACQRMDTERRRGRDDHEEATDRTGTGA
jgi:hypothetical protein